MPFATANGIALPVFRDSWEESYAFVGDINNRAIDGSLLESRAGEKRAWSFTSTPTRALWYRAWRRYLGGWGQGWNFDHPTWYRYSIGGLRDEMSPITASRNTSTPTPKFGASNLGMVASDFFGIYGETELNVMRKYPQGTGEDFGWDPTIDGWTIAFHYYNGATWDFYTAIGNVEVARGASDPISGVTQYKNGVAGDVNLGRVINVQKISTVSSKGIGVAGWDIATGSPAAVDYDDLVVYPFQFPDLDVDGFGTWATQLEAFADVNALGMQPIIKLDGDGIENGPVYAIGRVSKAKQMGARNSPQGATSFEAANYIFQCTFTEI